MNDNFVVGRKEGREGGRKEGREGRRTEGRKEGQLLPMSDSLGISSTKRQRIRVDGDAFAKQSSMASTLVVFTLEFTLVITGASGWKGKQYEPFTSVLTKVSTIRL